MERFKKFGNVYYLQGMEDTGRKYFALQEDLFFGAILCSKTATYEQVKTIYDKHEMEMPEQSCKVGKYVYTNNGLMFKMYGLYYELDENREPVDLAYEGYIEITRAVSSFDF